MQVKYIEGIVVCIGGNSLNLLKITLPQNRKFFDNYIVITSSTDKETQEFCKDYPVTLLITDAFYDRGAKFNRGPAFNQAFQISRFKDEICLLDCDIFIPDSLGKVIREKNFDIDYMYGSRRVIVPKYYDFNMLCNWKDEYYDKLWIPFGIGYGYMQVFNYNSSTIKKYGLFYPDSYDVSNADWQFRNLWGETINDNKEYIGNLIEIPEKCWHLGEPNIEGGHKFFA